MDDKTKGSENLSTASERLEDLPAVSLEIAAHEAERIKGAAYALGDIVSNDLGPRNIQKKS